MTPLLDAQEIARRLNVSLATAYREIRKRMLHVVVARRALRVTESAFDAYLRRRSEQPVKTQRPRVEVRRDDGPQVDGEPRQDTRPEGSLIVRPVLPRKKRAASSAPLDVD